MQENLSLYHIFYTVSRTGNISTAAKELYISQPSAAPLRSWKAIWTPLFSSAVPEA